MHPEGLNPPDPFNQSLKKSILWNAVEPGDPYDIKKSMIAKLPGDKKMFMGNKLELVCLLQAAEIERLALNLEQYKIRLRERQKSELDRHSYEIQIKELAARLQNEEGLRGENFKLKNYIDRLNQQLEQIKQRSSAGNNQQNVKYQQALLQIQTLTEHNTLIVNQNANMRRLFEGKNAQYAQAEATIRELQQQLNNRADQQTRMADYENKFSLFGKQIQRLNLVLKSKTTEVQSLTDQLAQNENYLRSKRQQNQYLINNQIKISQELNLLKSQLKRSKFQQDQQRVREYESRLQACNKEINSLNIKLSSERQQFQNYRGRLNAENEQKESIIKDLESRIQQLDEQNQKYDQNSSLVTRQIQRLNSVLRAKIDEINTFQARNNRLTEENQFYTQQISILQKQSSQLKVIHKRMEELEFQLGQEQAAKQRLAKINNDLVKRQAELDQSAIEQYEIRINYLNQDVKRFNDSNIALQNQNKALKDRISHSEFTEQEFRKVSRQLSDIKNLMVQEDINKKNSIQRINDLTRKNTEYQKIINQLSGEIQRLNQILKAKLQEISIIQNKLQYFSGQNNRLVGELKAHNENEGKIEDYENKFALISLEVERLNNNLKLKFQQAAEAEQQVNNLRKENANLKNIINQINFKSNQSIQQINEQMHRQLSLKDEELNRMRNADARASEMHIEIQKLNQILKQKIEEIKDKDSHFYRLQAECESLRNELREAKNRQKQLSDLQRLNNLLRLKVEEAARWQASNNELIKNNQILQGNLDSALSEMNANKRQLNAVRLENSSLIDQLNQYKNKVDQILKEFQRLQQMLESFRRQNNELKQQIFNQKQELSGGNLKEKNHKLIEEIERLKVIIEQQKEEIRELRLILSQDHSFEKRIRQQLSLIVILCAEIESLRKRVEDKEKQVQDVRRESLVPLKA